MSEELSAELINLIMAGNEFGSGDDFLAADNNTFQRADQRFNFFNDLLKTSGLTIDDLLGIVAPAHPGDAPVGSFGTNDLRSVYAGNPLLSAAMDKIDRGLGPIMAADWIKSQVEEFPEQAEFLPESDGSEGVFKGLGGQGAYDTSSVAALLSDYATKNVQIARDNTAYQQELDTYEQKVQEFNSYGTPGNEFEAGGSRSVDDILGRFEGLDFPTRAAGPERLPERAPNRFLGSQPDFATPSTRYTDNDGVSRLTQESLDRQRGNSNVTDFLVGRFDPNGPSRRRSENPEYNQPRPGVAGVGEFEPDQGRFRAEREGYEQRLQGLASELVKKRKATATSSQEQEDQRARFMAEFAVIFGQAPPTS